MTGTALLGSRSADDAKKEVRDLVRKKAKDTPTPRVTFPGNAGVDRLERKHSTASNGIKWSAQTPGCLLDDFGGPAWIAAIGSLSFPRCSWNSREIAATLSRVICSGISYRRR